MQINLQIQRSTNEETVLQKLSITRQITISLSRRYYRETSVQFFLRYLKEKNALKSRFFSKNRESIKQGRRGQRNTWFFFGFLYVTGSASPWAWIRGALMRYQSASKI